MVPLPLGQTLWLTPEIFFNNSFLWREEWLEAESFEDAEEYKYEPWRSLVFGMVMFRKRNLSPSGGPFLFSTLLFMLPFGVISVLSFQWIGERAQ